MVLESNFRYFNSRPMFCTLAISLLAGLSSACNPKSETQLTPPTVATAASPAPQNGRYAIVFSPNVRADTFLLDTKTGNVWQQVKYTDLDGEPMVWTEMTIEDGRAESDKIPGSTTYWEMVQLSKKKTGDKKQQK